MNRPVENHSLPSPSHPAAAPLDRDGGAGELRWQRGDLMTLTKARLSLLVVLTTLAGFCLGRGGSFDVWRLGHTLFGTLLCAFGAAIFNQLMEVDADARMHRTAGRPLPARRIPPAAAFALGMICSAWGMVHLNATVNIEAAAVAAATLFVYIFVYTPLKRRSSVNTLVGAVAGALPPLIGWVAAAGPQITGFRWGLFTAPQAMFLFALLFLWQMPHFLAINWMYRDEYRRGGFIMWSNDDDSGSKTSALALAFAVLLLPVGALPVATGFAHPVIRRWRHCIDRMASLAGMAVPA